MGMLKYIFVGYMYWVFCVLWFLDGERFVIGSMDKLVWFWDFNIGKVVGLLLIGYVKWVINIVWELYYLWKDGMLRLVSVSKDLIIWIWVVNIGWIEYVLFGYRSSVSCVKWGGMGFIYFVSYDKIVRVWDVDKGIFVYMLLVYVYWVNYFVFFIDFVLCISFYDYIFIFEGEEVRCVKVKERFEKVVKVQGKVVECFVFVSDDFIMYLWDFF